MLISICHATRRPQLALEQKARWLAAAKHPERVEYIFAIDNDADVVDTVCAIVGHAYVTVMDPAGCVAAFNAAAAASLGEIIIAGSDDTWPVANWDELIIQRFQAFAADSETRGKRGNEPESVTVRFGSSCPKTVIGEIYANPLVPFSPTPVFGPMVLLVGDGLRQDRLATMPVVTRAWYAKFGYLFPPQFVSVGADVWITERAARDGCLVDATDLQFEHRHAFYGKAAMDQVYQDQNDPARYQLAETALTELLEPLPIALCMIVGNEAAIIERCLDAARDAFDELCIVRAIGEQDCDPTIGRALSWCLKNQKEFRFRDYENTTPGLKHVDNFSAARNLSFSLAGGAHAPSRADECASHERWLLWLDADDILDPAAVLIIRQHAARNTRFAAHAFPYRMPTGGIFPRERLIRQGAGRWVGSVHETCEITGDVSKCYESAVVHHEPNPSPDKSACSAQRNLTILLQSEDFPRRDFYLCEEYFRLAMNAKAAANQTEFARLTLLSCQAGALFLECQDIAKFAAEAYEVHLNIADLIPDGAREILVEAIALNPCRREAFAQLAQLEMYAGDLGRAIQHWKFLSTIPVPKPQPWTHRGIWYTWAPKWLRVKILVVAGKLDDARKNHDEYWQDPEYAAGVAKHDPELLEPCSAAS